MSKPHAPLPALIHLIDRDGEKCGYANTDDQFGMVRLFLNFGGGAEHLLEISPACARKLAAALLDHAAEAEQDDQR